MPRESVNRTLTVAALLTAAWLALPTGPGILGQDERTIRRVMGPRRQALVVGNNAYAERPLRNARADGAAIRERLEALGFDVAVANDTTLRELEQAIDRFIARQRDADVALFFYAGHGMEVRGVNYLLPVDFVLRDLADVKYSAYNASRLLERMEGSGARLRLMILDACRDNPFTGERSGVGKGLAEMPGAVGTYVAFATSPGKTASDNVAGSYGLFTKHLLTVLRSPDHELDELFKRVRAGVYEESAGQQWPWISNNVLGRFHFRPPPPLPPGTTLSADDLWDQAVEIEAAKTAWSKRLEAMQTSFREAEAYEATEVSSALKAEYWQRFLDVYPEDNPYSASDETLREKAAVRLSHWRNASAGDHVPSPEAAQPVEIAKFEEIAQLKGHSAGVLSVAWSPDGHTLASGSDDLTVRLWDIESQEQVAQLKGHTAWVDSVAWSPDGRTLASVAPDKTVRLWDIGSRQQVAQLKGHSRWAGSVAWSPDGRTLASGAAEKKVRLWDVRSRKQVAVLRGDFRWVSSVAWSPDGRTLASGSLDGTVRLWDIGSRKQVAVLRGHSKWVLSVAWSPDGRTLASGSEDGTVRLWDIGSRKQVAVLDHPHWVISVAWSPDGRTLAWGSDDRTVRLWDVRSRKQVALLVGHSEYVRSVAWSPDGRTLASGSSDMTVRLWGVPDRR